MSKAKRLTKTERAYLVAMREMERTREPFTHAAMLKRFGWKSTAASYFVMTSLERKGYVEKGKRLSLVIDPVVTTKARRELRKAA